MKPLKDINREEIKHLKAACDLRGKVVLEIGCGDGVLTRQYARLTHHVAGIDPLASELRVAYHRTLLSKSGFIQGKAELLPLPGKYFDLVLFASSL